MADISLEEQQIRLRLKDDFLHFSEKALKIRVKAGSIEPLKLNAAQVRTHEAAEDMLLTTGAVRLLVLKARQLGISTYIEGRFYWRAIHRWGVRAFILTHRDQATANLFAIARRYHDNCPGLIKPQTRASSATELDFGVLDSGYRVGTAKAVGVGRADTIQYFHGSEVAYWSNADEHMAGVLQAVPKERDTEVWLESTANGIGGLFYNLWKATERGETEYRTLFIPWFWHDEYEEKAPEGWAPNAEFQEYAEAHSLRPEQTYWAYLKNAELAAANALPVDEICWRFRQEYPATAAEAFQASGTESYIPSELVLKARRFTAPDQSGRPLVLGVDSAREGPDRTRVIGRRGRVVGTEVNETWKIPNSMTIAGKIAKLIDIYNPAMVFIDRGGEGAAIYDRLDELRYTKQISLVNFGSAALDDRKYANRRAEMYGELRDWLQDPGGADLIDDDVLHSEIVAAGSRTNSLGQTLIESKEKVIERLGFSPDGSDAVVLTFAEPISLDGALAGQRNPQVASVGGSGDWDPHNY